ncbi:MAG TPA: hypothetical protein VKA46_03100 [Gemmataceae bacterium]|nr:hypothetical protein [Gemmataceae bacterium]
MPQALVIRGHYANRTFIPGEPLPATEGEAQLIVIPTETTRPAVASASLFDLMGKAPRLRSAEDIEAQIREEHDAWGEP